MKKVFLFCITVLMFSCKVDNSGSAPVLKKVVIAPTQAMIDAGTDETEFTTSDYIRFHYTVTDKDGDYDKGVVCIIDGNGEVVERKEDPYPDIISGGKITEIGKTTTYLPGKFAAGSWKMSVYYIDKAGNNSGTVVKDFIVE
jgi:hypothetical protein